MDSNTLLLIIIVFLFIVGLQVQYMRKETRDLLTQIRDKLKSN